jgi:hypothetical protein
MKPLRAVLLAGALVSTLAFACQDDQVRAYIKNDLHPYLTTLATEVGRIGHATCNLDLDQLPSNHPPHTKMCSVPPDFTTPPPPPPPGW